MHKIRSYEDDMRNFLSQKLWSLGTPLGSLGPGSQKGLPGIFSNVVFLHHWDPDEVPEKVSNPLLSKKLVALRKRCGPKTSKVGRSMFEFEKNGRCLYLFLNKMFLTVQFLI